MDILNPLPAIEEKCRRCIYRNTEYVGECKLLAVGLRKVGGRLVCDDFVERKDDAHE